MSSENLSETLEVQGVLQMTQCVQADVVLLVMELLTGKQDRVIEAARSLVAQPANVDPELLAKVVFDSGYSAWSRRMAAYVLGFLPVTEQHQHQMTLRRALSDPHLPLTVRTHAAEALGNLHDYEAAGLLEDYLIDEGESVQLRRWCAYALGELGVTLSERAAQTLAAHQPKGTLARAFHVTGNAFH